MNLTRRHFLKGVSIAALAGVSRTSTSAAISSLSPGLLPWPKPLGSPVTESLRPVIEKSRDVQTHYAKIVEVAGWMAYEELPFPNLAIPYGLEKTPDTAMDFVMVANTIDTAFTDFKTHVKFQVDFAGEHLYDSAAMIVCVKRAMDNGVPILDGNYLAKITRADMERIFAGNIEMPMLDEKMQLFHQVGAVLAAKYQGRYHNFIHSCAPTTTTV
jgi:hypothetical protein